MSENETNLQYENCDQLSAKSRSNDAIILASVIAPYMFFVSAQFVHFFFFGDLDNVCMHYLQFERMCGAPSLFLAAQFEIIVQFYFFRDLDGALSS